MIWRHWRGFRSLICFVMIVLLLPLFFLCSVFSRGFVLIDIAPVPIFLLLSLPVLNIVGGLSCVSALICHTLSLLLGILPSFFSHTLGDALTFNLLWSRFALFLNPHSFCITCWSLAISVCMFQAGLVFFFFFYHKLVSLTPLSLSLS